MDKSDKHTSQASIHKDSWNTSVISWRTAANFSSLPPCSPQLYVMEDKDKGKEGQITYYFPGKRGERSSDSSSPGSEKPPAKSVKFTESNMVEQADIWKVLNTIQDNTNKLLEENKALRDQYSELQKSLEFHIVKIETLATENESLKKEMKSLKRSLNKANEEREVMYEDLGTAINKLDDLEQYTRKHNLEIHGIPQTPDENIAERIITLGNVLNVTIRNDDIDICHRLQTSKNPSKHKPIMVRFKSYRAKKELYGARKQLKGQNLNQVFNGGDFVYINENLTRMRRQLFAEVWKRKKLEHWHSAWTIDGIGSFEVIGLSILISGSAFYYYFTPTPLAMR